MVSKKIDTSRVDQYGANRTNEEQSLLWIGAFRYYCGRMSYAVSWFCELLIRDWPLLPKHARDIIKRDLEEEFKRDDQLRVPGQYSPLGMDMDRREWERVRELWRNEGEAK